MLCLKTLPPWERVFAILWGCSLLCRRVSTLGDIIITFEVSSTVGGMDCTVDVILTVLMVSLYSADGWYPHSTDGIPSQY